MTFLLAFLLLAAAAEAQIYRWVDENGTVHFSQSPPPAAPKGSAVDVIPDEPRVPMVTGGPPPPEEEEEAPPSAARGQARSEDREDEYEPGYREERLPVGRYDDEGGDVIVVQPPVDWDRARERRDEIRERTGGVTRPAVGGGAVVRPGTGGVVGGGRGGRR